MAPANISDASLPSFPQPASFMQPMTLPIDSKFVEMQPFQWPAPVQVYVIQIPVLISHCEAGYDTWYAQDNVPCIDHSSYWPSQAAIYQQATSMVGKEGSEPCIHHSNCWPSQGPINQQTVPMVGKQVPAENGDGWQDVNHQRAPMVGEEIPIGLKGRVWAMARSAQGSKDVQQALDDASDVLRVIIASELRTRVWEAMKCRHAHHVLQKCISTMRRQDFQFIIDELLHMDGPLAVGAAARHRYGCRVLQRLFEHCSAAQLEGIVQNLLSDAVELCTHTWGVYVMQHLFEHGTQRQTAKLSQVLTENISKLGGDELAPLVFTKAFSYASSEDRIALAHELIAQPGLLSTMGCKRHGHVAVEEALDLVDHQARLGAIANLRSHMHELIKTRYGRRLAGLVEKHIVN